MKYMKLILIALILSITLPSLSFAGQNENNQPQTNGFERLIVVGDSLSNQRGVQNEYPDVDWPPAPYYEGHFSNGPNYVKFLADDLGIKEENVLNYAVGGAKAAEGNVLNHDPQFVKLYGKREFKNLDGQIHAFLDDEKIQKNKDLFVVYMGSNDYIPFFRELKYIPSKKEEVNALTQKIGDMVMHTVGLIEKGIHTLHKHGASYFLIPNLAPFERLPMTTAALEHPFSSDASLKAYQDKYKNKKEFLDEFITLNKLDETYTKNRHFKNFQQAKFHEAKKEQINLLEGEFKKDYLKEHIAEFMLLSFDAYQKIQKNSFEKQSTEKDFDKFIENWHHTHRLEFRHKHNFIDTLESEKKFLELEKAFYAFLKEKYTDYIHIQHEKFKPYVLQFISGVAEMHNGILAQQLSEFAKKEGVEIEIANVHQFLNDILDDPTAHGFENTTDPLFHKEDATEEDHHTHVFVDGVHPTSKIHRTITHRMLPQVIKMAEIALKRQREEADTINQNANIELAKAQTGTSNETLNALTGLAFASTDFNLTKKPQFFSINTNKQSGKYFNALIRPLPNFVIGSIFEKKKVNQLKNEKPFEDQSALNFYSSLFNKNSYLNISYRLAQNKLQQDNRNGQSKSFSIQLGHNIHKKQLSFGPVLEYHHKNQLIEGISEHYEFYGLPVHLVTESHQHKIDKIRLGKHISWSNQLSSQKIESQFQLAYDFTKSHSKNMKMTFVNLGHIGSTYKLPKSLKHELRATLNTKIPFEKWGQLNLNVEALASSKKNLKQRVGVHYKFDL